MNGKTVPLLTWFSPTALLPLIQLLQSRWLRGLIYIHLCKTTNPVAQKKTAEPSERREKVSHIGFKSHKKQPGKENRDSYGFLHTLTHEIFYSCEKKGVKKPSREKSMLCCCALRCLNGLTVWWYECAIEVIKVSIQCHCIVLLYSHNDSRVQ